MLELSKMCLFEKRTGEFFKVKFCLSNINYKFSIQTEVTNKNSVILKTNRRILKVKILSLHLKKFLMFIETEATKNSVIFKN